MKQMKNRRVIISADQCGAENSGMGVYAYEVGRRLTAKLTKAGISVTVLIRADAQDMIDAVTDIGASVITLMSSSRSIYERLVEIHVYLPRLLGEFSHYYSLDHKVPEAVLRRHPSFATIHDTCPIECKDEFGPLKRFYYAQVFKHLIGHALSIVTVSKFTEKRLCALLCGNGEKIWVSPNGFDENRFSPVEQCNEVALLRARYRLEPGYFLFVGRVSPRKNLRVVVDAVAQLRHRGAEPRVALVGPSGWRNQDEWRYIEETKVSGSFQQVGYVKPEHLPMIYRQAAALLYTSKCEGFGLPVLEALACGTPVMTAIGTSSAELGDRFVGLIPHDDADSLANWMMRTAEYSPTYHGALSSELCNYLSRYSWSATAEAIFPRLLRQIETEG